MKQYPRDPKGVPPGPSLSQTMRTWTGFGSISKLLPQVTASMIWVSEVRLVSPRNKIVLDGVFWRRCLPHLSSPRPPLRLLLRL